MQAEQIDLVLSSAQYTSALRCIHCVITEYFNIWRNMPPALQPTYIPRVAKKSSKITATVVYVYEV